MTEYVYRKFPNHIETIQALLQKDATFREICDDYEEMCTWRAAQSGSIDPNSLEYVQAFEIIRDLEYEIDNMLKDRGF